MSSAAAPAAPAPAAAKIAGESYRENMKSEDVRMSNIIAAQGTLLLLVSAVAVLAICARPPARLHRVAPLL